MNQLLGLFKYGRGTVPALKKIDKVIDDQIVQEVMNILLKELSINDDPGYTSRSMGPESEDKYVVLIPGGFKPPHKGHYAMIENYAKMPNVEAVVILSGDKPREGVTKEMSQQLFDLYGGLSDKVMFVDDNLPFRAAFEKLGEEDFVRQFGDNVVFTLGCSDKGGDEERSIDFAKWFEDNPDENILDVKVGVLGACPAEESDGAPLSASAMRKAVREGDDEILQAHLPGDIDISSVKSILSAEEVLPEMILRMINEVINEVYRTQDCEKKDGSDGDCKVTFGDGHTACYDSCGVAKMATSGELDEIHASTYELPSRYREEEPPPTPGKLAAAAKAAKAGAEARMIISFNKAVDKQKEKDRLSAKFNKKTLEEEELEEISSAGGGAAGGYSLPLGEKPKYFKDGHPKLRGSVAGITLIYKRSAKK